MLPNINSQTGRNTNVQTYGPVTPRDLRIGGGFNALHFNEEDFRGLMDPLVMVDHFTMTEPTFDSHPHAGISAVTMMFEDSAGTFLNRDSLGNRVPLQAGDLYWLAAARGAVHEEVPAAGSRIHALQIFVNLPARLKTAQPRAQHVKAGEIPLLTGPGKRVRVVLGESNGVSGASAPLLPFTLLDGYLDTNSIFNHRLPADKNAWIYVVEGEIEIAFNGQRQRLAAGRAFALHNRQHELALDLRALAASHFVLMSARPLEEPFVKHGPFVMSSAEDVRRVIADYKAGRLGRISQNQYGEEIR